jgi:hypothetical protein
MFKKPLRFPQQEEAEPMAGGIGGLHDNISPTNRPLNLLSVCRNMRRFGVTGAQTRPGRAILGDQVGSTRILGMSAYYTSSLEKLIVQAGTNLKVYNTQSKKWDTLKSDMKDAPFQAATFNDLHIITNGTDDVQKYNGSTISVLGGSPPKGKYITTAYQRVFLSGVSGSPHLLYVSDIALADVWSGGDSGAIPVNDKDGDEIKWAMIYKSNMVIWKRYGIFELHGPELGYTTDDWSVAPIAAIGTPNGRTIADVNGYLYWLSDSENSKGIVRWGGGRPVLISEPVDNIIASINYSAIATACAVSSGDGEYLLAVPTGTSQYPDTIIVYNANDNSWWVWDGWNPTAFLPFRLVGDTSSLLMGDNDGYVYVMGGQLDEEPEA